MKHSRMGYMNVEEAVAYALANGWTPPAIVAVLTGAIRGEDGHALPWCKRCDRPITDALQMPTEEENVYDLWCPYCLTGPSEES